MDFKRLKRFFKERYGLAVRVRTIGKVAKGGWVDVWMPFDSPVSFDADLRQLCIRIAYPNNPDLHVRVSAGNIQGKSISLIASQWEQVLTECGIVNAESE